MKNKEIKDFFQYDYTRLVLLTGGQTTDINLKDKSRFNYYQNVFNVVWLAIHELENTPQHPFKRLIIERHINRVPLKDMEKRIKFGSNATNRKNNEALKSFASLLIQEQIANNVYPLLEFE